MSKEKEMSLKIRPLDDRVVVEPLEAEEKTAGGILLPDTAKQKPQRGRVLAVGPGKQLESGTRVALNVQKGDEVIYGKVNWIGTVTLRYGASDITTVVSDDRVTSDCEISLMPLTANAASMLVKVYIGTADLAPGVPWAANVVGQFTINHPILTDDDFSYRYSIKG